MLNKKMESGRSLVETLAVLVVMAILLLMFFAGYSFAMHKYRQNQTIKAISELAVRYKLHPISKTGLIEIKSIYPEAERADAVNMKTADTDTGRVQLEVSEDTSYFAVAVNNILDDSCAEYLEKGEYDAALLLNGDKYNSKSDTEYLAFGKDFLKDFDLTKLTDEQKGKLNSLGLNVNSSKEAVIDVICTGPKAKTAAFVFGDKCPKRGASHYIEGKCWPCPRGQKEDRYGACCDESRVNSKEYCYSCGCPKETPICDADSGQCVECTRNDDCKEEGKTQCDMTTHKCVECVDDTPCSIDEDHPCPRKCVSKTHTCSDGCDTAKPWWKLSDGVCVCEKTLQAGQECSAICGPNCCAAGLSCNAGHCCPKDLPGYNELCVAGCGCNSGAHLVCNSGNRCVCDEANGYYWDESAKRCVKGCLVDGTLHHVGALIGDCGICQAGGTVGQDTTKTKRNQCYKDCDTTNGSSTLWQFVLKNPGKDVVCSPNCCATGEYCVNGNNCCTNDGENATTGKPAVCTSNNCCKSRNCSGLTATENGHCCPPTQVWNDTNKKCVTPICSLTQGSVCSKNGLAPNCCATNLSCVSTDAKGNNGHCCANNKFWNTTPKPAMCTTCLRNWDGTTGTGACEKTDNPLCQPNRATNPTDYVCGPCPSGQVWDETQKKCVTPICSLTQGSVCSANGLAPNCCATSLSCVSTDAKGNNGHCCPSGQVWDNTNKKCVVCVEGDQRECAVCRNNKWEKRTDVTIPTCMFCDLNTGKWVGHDAVYPTAANDPEGRGCGQCNKPAKSGEGKVILRNPNPCPGRSDGRTYCEEKDSKGNNKWLCECPSGQVWDEKTKQCKQSSCQSSGGVQMWEHGGNMTTTGRHGEEYCCKDTIIQHNVCRDSYPLFIGYLADKETSNKYGGSSTSRFECCPSDRIQKYRKDNKTEGDVLTQCCQSGYHADPEINAECCPKNKTWNSTTRKCVDPNACATGTLLYQKKGTSKNGQGSEQGCCDPSTQKLVTKQVGYALFSGYKLGDTTKYGCCPNERVSGNACCRPEEESVDNKCCKKENIYTVNGVKKCCPGKIQGNYCIETVSLGCTRICSKCKKKDSHCNNVQGPVSWDIPANTTVKVELDPSLTHGGDSCYGHGDAYDETVVYVTFDGKTKKYPKRSYPATFTASTTSKTKLTVEHEDYTSSHDGAVLTCVSYDKKTQIK